MVFRALGQLALVETPTAGALVLAAVALINPWSALGAVAGAALGTLLGDHYQGYSREEWRSGLSGFNLAVIGIVAGGAIATDIWRVDAILMSVALCIALELGLRRLLLRWSLPILTMPAALAVIISSLMLAPAGTWLWVSPALPPLGQSGVALAVLCVVLAMASKSLSASLQVAMLTFVAILVSQAMGIEPLSVAGLWAFTIAPASFTVHAVFMGGSLLGGIAGLVAAIVGVIVWLLWYAAGLGDVAPPLLVPFVVGVWCGLLLFRRIGQPAILRPAFWQAVTAIWSCRAKGRRVIVVVANGPNSAIALNGSQAGFVCTENFILSGDTRRKWWRHCNDLRRQLNIAAPNKCSRAIARLQRRGFVHRAATFSMDRQLVRAGVSDVVALQGDLNSVRCVGCHTEGSWPPANIWRTCDLRCSDCGNLVMPGSPVPRDVFQAAWEPLVNTLSLGSVVILLGTMEDSRASRVVIADVRRLGARIISVTTAPSSTPLDSREVLLLGDIDTVMGALTWVLTAFSLPLRKRRRDHTPVETPLRGVDS